MKMLKSTIISLIFAILLFSPATFAQDKRTVETKVADLLARLPANDNQLSVKLMNDMLSLGEQGVKQICDQVIPAGTGDDTKARFAIENFSRFLSKLNSDNRKNWEKICIGYALSREDNGVKDFFMKQLQIIGGDASIDALKGYLTAKDLCEPALAVILAAKGSNTESVLAESLKNKDLACPAAVLNALASIKSKIAVNEYIIWSATQDVNTRASALNALAVSGAPEALEVLSKAALDVQYRWEHTGATKSLLNYADVVGTYGDLKTMDKICKLVISKCNDNISIQNKSAALGIYTAHHGIDAMPLILKAAAHQNKIYRTAAMRYSLDIPGSEVVSRWTAYYKKAIPAAKPEIITMLGVRGDELAAPLVNSALSDIDVNVRKEAAEAIVKLSGSESMNALINYMLVSSGDEDQEAAKQALMTITNNDNIKYILPVLKEGSPAAKKTAIEILAWNKDNKYFSEIFQLTASQEEPVRTAAFKALPSLAGEGNQKELIDLLSKTDNEGYVGNLQDAIASAANQVKDPEKRSDLLINAMKQNNNASLSSKIIPILAKTGGKNALAAVMHEFENGNADMRDISFKSLTNWGDYSAAEPLFQIVASRNKTFEAPAFEGYIRRVKAADITDENKYLALRKIIPFAVSTDRKNDVLTEMGNLKTYQTLFFVGSFLDDPAKASAAAKASMYIALPTVNSQTGLYGEMVRQILEKAAQKLTGQESDYDREMLNKYLASMPADEGFKPMFNGKDLSGWHGLVENPVARAKMKPAELAKKQAEADKKVPLNWSVKDGCILFNGKGDNLCSIKEYSDFEMLVDWKITKEGDSGIYLRGTPQVQIWDTSRTDVGAQVGSGGLYNNQVNESKPLMVADNPVGEWNTFRILMIGEKVSVWLNGMLVVDNVTMDNYWDRSIPIFPSGPIELQAHGTDLAFRDIYVREISEKEFNLTPEERSQGFVSLFNGRNLDNWVGNKQSYVVENGMVVVKPGEGSGGNLYTEKEYADFAFRFEFKLTPAANNGIGIRAPLQGDAAYVGMEIQVLDDTAPVYANLQPYQYHGSVYGVIPAKKGYQNPVGEWNYEEIVAEGTHIKVTLNGTVIVDGDIAGPRDNGTMDHNEHPGLKNEKGHIGFLGHGSELMFRNIRIKDLSK
jgi:HEAT repeat protein